MKCQELFSLKNKNKYFKLSSTADVKGTLSVNVSFEICFDIIYISFASTSDALIHFRVRSLFNSRNAIAFTPRSHAEHSLFEEVIQ